MIQIKIIFILISIQFCFTKNLTRISLTNGVQNGVVCIDGSTPAYYFRKGVGSGENKFVIGFLGGGWCHSHKDCYERSKNIYGSSKHWPNSIRGLGITSDDPLKNPQFHNWNIVFIWYCDGSSYAGDLNEPYYYNGTQLFSRGARIWQAVQDDLETNHQLQQASNVVLYGESAGGTACWTHLDALQQRLSHVDVRGVCDSSFFIVVDKFSGGVSFEPKIKQVYETFNLTGSLNENCLKSTMKKPWHCLIGSHLYQYIQTPLFVLQSQIDCDQLQDVGLNCLPAPDNKPHGVVRACNQTELNYLEYFTSKMRTIGEQSGLLKKNTKNGLYFDQCLHHSIGLFGDYWNNKDWSIDGHTASMAVQSWVDGQQSIFSSPAALPWPNQARCTLAFQACLGSRQYLPWQCGPAPWQQHGC